MKQNISQKGTMGLNGAIKGKGNNTSMKSLRESDREVSPANDSPTNMPALTFTGRIGAWSARHRWLVIAASVMMLVLAVLVSTTFKVQLLDANEIGEGESGEAIRLLDERFGEGGAPSEQLVFSHPSLDVSDPAYRSTVEELVQELRAMPEVSAVASYYELGDPRLVSADR